MQTELYSDGIGEITISGSIVRVDFMSLSATERDANNTPKSVLRQRIILSVEGFANSVDVMQKALAGLVDAGVVRRTALEPSGSQRDASAPNGSTRAGESAGPHARTSPNFP